MTERETELTERIAALEERLQKTCELFETRMRELERWALRKNSLKPHGERLLRLESKVGELSNQTSLPWTIQSLQVASESLKERVTVLEEK